jgi:hypothetical protein
VILAELEEIRIRLKLGHMPSSQEEFLLAPIQSSLFTFSDPSEYLIKHEVFEV